MLIPRSTFWFALPFAFAAARQAAGVDFPFPTPVASASMQAVSDLNGDSAYAPPSPAGPPPVSGTGTLYYQGIVLNAPATMLSTAASTSLNASNSTTTFGGYGQWQVFVQTNSQGDLRWHGPLCGSKLRVRRTQPNLQRLEPRFL